MTARAPLRGARPDEVTMKIRCIVTCALALGLNGWAVAATADETAPFLEGTVSVGAHQVEQNGEFDKVGEYISGAGVDEYQADAEFRLEAGDASTLMRIQALYRDADTRRLGLDLDTRGRLSADFDFRSFAHHLDHDLLENMQAREVVSDGAGGFNPGGKMVFHTDNDPRGRYAIRYENVGGGLDYRLDTIENGKVYLRYRDQQKHGWKQSLSLDHCSSCHVESRSRQVDEQRRSWEAGTEGTFGGLSYSYAYGKTEYRDRSDGVEHDYLPAQHPVYGDVGPHPSGNPAFPYGAEFASRLSFQDVTLPYARGLVAEKSSHHLGLRYELDPRNVLRGSYSHTRSENSRTGISSAFDGYAASWVAVPGKRTRLSARFVKYEVDADDYYVDLLPYREGRAGGGQDFDWTRVSAANREVLQTDLALRTKLSRGGNLRLDWRHKTIDRAAMAQTQTTYYAADGVNVAVPSSAVPGETTSDRLRVSLDKRFGRKGNGRVSYAYTTIDRPFMNPTGMCEEGLNGEPHELVGNGSVYYFQRERYGNGTSLPNSSHQFSARGSWQLSPRAALNGYVNAAWEENDDLNSYSFERTVYSPGVNLWVAPDDGMMVTMGYGFNSVESNASLCPPIFDG